MLLMQAFAGEVQGSLIPLGMMMKARRQMTVAMITKLNKYDDGFPRWLIQL